jgi:hypothetical protein
MCALVLSSIDLNQLEITIPVVFLNQCSRLGLPIWIMTDE